MNVRHLSAAAESDLLSERHGAVGGFGVVLEWWMMGRRERDRGGEREEAGDEGNPALNIRAGPSPVGV